MKVKQYTAADREIERKMEAIHDEIRLLNNAMAKRRKELKALKGSSSLEELRRKEIIPIDEVKNAVNDVLFTKKKKNSMVNIRGDMIKGNSDRYKTFFTKGLRCSCCGIEGKYFAKEKHLGDGHFHLNLYGVDKDGNEVLMTKDHIIPASKGGKDDISNYQTMCRRCNELKADKN